MKEIVRRAIEAKNRAYAIYSSFPVGSALELESGEIYDGCNIENKSFSLTCCAERVAIFKAISDGKSNLHRIAIATDDDNFISPCGACRQVISEFAKADFELILINKEQKTKSIRFEQIFPSPFEPASSIGGR